MELPEVAREVYEFVATANAEQLAAHAATMQAGSVAALLLDAVLAQYEGRVERSVQLFERALQSINVHGRPYVADLLAPLLIMRNGWDRYAELRASVCGTSRIEGCLLAFDAVAFARAGDTEASIHKAAAAERLLSILDDDFLRARIQQRIGHAAYERGDYERAVEQALESARVFEEIGAGRSAAASYSIVYNIAHAVSGDLQRADQYARKMVDAARRSGDRSFMMTGLVAQYEIASECGDALRSQALREHINALALPKQYQERFARGIADVLIFAAAGDFPTFRANVVLLRDSVVCDRSMIALTLALKSLGEAALDEFEQARRSSRNALSLAALREPNEPAYAKRYRRLARAIAACTCTLIKDQVRAQRAAQKDADTVALMAVARGGDYHHVLPRIQGYARAVAAAYEALSRTYRQSSLSSAEFEVLRLLADGLTAPQIAQDSKRSVHTVRAHTRSIIEKFGVSGRAAAVAFARRSGLIS